MDDWDRRIQKAEEPEHVRLNVFAVIVRCQRSHPAIEHLKGLRSGFGLSIQVDAVAAVNRSMSAFQAPTSAYMNDLA